MSFNVTFLYTNVPIKDSLVISINEFIEIADLHKKTKFPPYVETIELLLARTWSRFNGKFITQWP